MLSRFCNPSIKLASFAYTLNSVSFNRMPEWIYLQQKSSNYATSTAGAKYKQSLNLASLLKDLKVRVENKNQLNQQDLECLIHVITKQKVDSQQALEIFRLCAYGKIDKRLSNIVFKIWELFEDKKNSFDIHHYNYALQFAKNGNDSNQMEKIFDEIISNGLKPNFVSYQRLLETYCRCGNMEKAVEILDMMDKANMHLSERAYNNLVQCHIICGDIENANAMMESMGEKNFKITYSTWRTLLAYYSKKADWENIQTLLKKMKAENVEVMNQDILNATCELAANGHADKVNSMLEYLTPGVLLRMAIKSAIPTFIEKKQSAILPLIIQKYSKDIESNYKHLIDEMVRLSAPSDEFDEIIKAIEANGFTVEKNFHIFEAGFEGSSEFLISKLLKHIKATGKEVSQSLFEKMFEATAKIGPEHVLKVVNLMCGEFQIRPDITFVRDFILPGLNAKENPIGAYAKLQTTKINMRSVVMALANMTLNNGNLKLAHDFLSSMDGYYNTEIIKRPLINAFLTTGDVGGFVSIVRLIYDNLKYSDQYRKNENKTTDMKNVQNEFAAEMLLSAILRKEYNPELTKSLLLMFIEEGLTITPKAADTIQKRLKLNSATEIGGLLEKLSKENLELKPIQNVRRSAIASQMSSIDLHNILEVRMASGHSIASTEKLLFLAYIREGNVADLEALLAKGSFSLSNADYALLIELYTNVGHLQKALDILKRVCASNVSFKLDFIKVGKLVTLMFKENKNFDEIDDILSVHCPTERKHRIFIFEHLLDDLAANSSQEMVKKLYESLVTYNYIQPMNETLAPLINVCLKNGAYTEAIEQFEKVADEHKIFPMSMVVFKKMIEQNEIDLLQRAFDAYEKIHGVSNALSHLGIAFVECNRVEQAKATFKNKRTKNISKRIARECTKFVEHNRIEAAKTLLAATRGLYCDRHVIYDSLLSIYIKQNKAQEALELWTEMANDDISTKNSFIVKLYNFLTANNVEIPHDLRPKLTERQNFQKNEATN